MTTYALNAPFYIDNGELDGVDARAAFVLGAEFVMFYIELTKTSGEFAAQVHDENTERCVKLCDLYQRKVTYVDGADWVTLNVGAKSVS